MVAQGLVPSPGDGAVGSAASEYRRRHLMHVIDLVIAGGWVVFWIGWLAAAFAAKSGRSRRTRSVGVRVVMVLLIIVLERIPGLRPAVSDYHHLTLATIGLGLFVVGLAVAVWARLHLGRNWGTPMSEKANPELVTTGPYRWVRNPIYTGLIVAMIGTALAVSLQYLVVAVVVAGFFVYSAVTEQRFMAKQFPDTYPAYQHSTKLLIPFIL